MADKLLVIMSNANPKVAAQMVPPLSQALVAAAMEFEVEMIFTGFAGELLKKGVAETMAVSPTSDRSVYDMIKEASVAGVKFKVCTSALETWGDDFVAEVGEVVGSTYLISEAMDDNTVVFTY